MSDEASTTMGMRIRAARRALGMTQEQLAAAVGVTRSAVAQWKPTGPARSAPTSPVAAALGLTVEHLLTGMFYRLGCIAGEGVAMLRAFRACEEGDRALLLRTAVRLHEIPGCRQRSLDRYGDPSVGIFLDTPVSDHETRD